MCAHLQTLAILVLLWSEGENGVLERTGQGEAHEVVVITKAPETVIRNRVEPVSSTPSPSSRRPTRHATQSASRQQATSLRKSECLKHF